MLNYLLQVVISLIAVGILIIIAGIYAQDILSTKTNSLKFIAPLILLDLAIISAYLLVIWCISLN